MFYLREVNKETGSQLNQVLGECYELIQKREFVKSIIKKEYDYLGQEYVDTIYAILVINGTDKRLIRSVNDSFVMTENGSTYEKL